MKKTNMLILPLCFLMAFLIGCDCEVDKSESNTSKYTITYDANGHATAPETKTVESGYKLTAEDLPTLSENGFTFGGWKNGGVEAKVGDKVKSNITLVADWTEWGKVAKPSFSVTSDEIDYGDTVEITCSTPDAIIYYTLDGNEPTSASTKYEKPITITNDTTIKALALKGGMNASEVTSITYKIKLYTVTFDANGHGTAPEPVTGKHKGETITLPAALTETGYLFKKWNDGSTDYNAEEEYTVNGNVTIKAIWKEIPNVTNLTAKCTASGTVKLTWTNPIDADFAKVVITYGTSGSVTVLKTVSPNNEATVTDLTNGTEYTFTVKAYDEGGNASSGVSVNCTPGLLGGLFGTPTGGQTQGALVKESWMADNGNLIVDGTEIAKTSEVIVIPKGTVAKISMTQAAAKGELFTDSRKVKLSPFVMSQYEVTRGLFKAVMGDAYYSSLGPQIIATGTADENPVTLINWFDAIVFCNKLSSLCGLEPVYSYDFSTDGSGKMTNPDYWFNDTTNLSATVPTDEDSTNYSNWKDKVVINLKANGYRLPTEAEWEFCARGGDPNAEDWGYTYSGSNTVGEVAWFRENLGNSGTNIAGCMNKANRLGLYDMSGNVKEWCDDYYSIIDDSKYTDSEGYVKDPLVVSVFSDRGLRGGCWLDYAYLCEVGFLDYNDLYRREIIYGFRLVRSTQTE